MGNGQGDRGPQSGQPVGRQEAREFTPPPAPGAARVTSGVRVGDTAALPAPLRSVSAHGAAETPLEDTDAVGVVKEGPPQPEAPSTSGGLPTPTERAIIDRLRGPIDALVNRLVESAKVAVVDEVQRRLREFAEQNEANASAVNDDIGAVRGDVTTVDESVRGLKSADEARREALDALNKVVHALIGRLQTFETDLGAIKGDAEETRHELEALRQADAGASSDLERLKRRVDGIEQAVGELRGAFRGIRDEALPDIRKAAVRAEQAVAAASAQVAELLPRLEQVEALATKMRSLQNFMDRVEALEGWRDRHSADIAEIAARVGLNELVEELRGALPPERRK